ncbi:hypothetical protein [Sanguibacter antarcticus]|uniref:Uncharacterized protein n=1 Tax=Sanguibacter antarcticus TaxID=372484 RepID=A0A2A9E6K0_9MICO|nr:hypothetical protein [Sanguibacter antarcticus]PFG34464.1 hypothetical protein ATL42_2374 [Sanguibacter antarcticus]
MSADLGADDQTGPVPAEGTPAASPFLMVGDDGDLCVDGVCAVPRPPAEQGPATV